MALLWRDAGLLMNLTILSTCGFDATFGGTMRIVRVQRQAKKFETGRAMPHLSMPVGADVSRVPMAGSPLMPG